MQFECRVSVDGEAACSLLRMIRNEENENMNQGGQHLLSTDPALDTATHLM